MVKVLGYVRAEVNGWTVGGEKDGCGKTLVGCEVHVVVDYCGGVL